MTTNATLRHARESNLPYNADYDHPNALRTCRALIIVLVVLTAAGIEVGERRSKGHRGEVLLC